ncbi:hypothetical protein VTK56DRAFT_5144 [Thermocarpiscus australiensis]
MTRWSHYDSDEERLPEGMTRVGYDADTQTHTYRDTDGSYWESSPGSRYGTLRRVSGAVPRSPPSQAQARSSDDDIEEERHGYALHDPDARYDHWVRPTAITATSTAPYSTKAKRGVRGVLDSVRRAMSGDRRRRSAEEPQGLRRFVSRVAGSLSRRLTGRRGEAPRVRAADAGRPHRPGGGTTTVENVGEGLWALPGRGPMTFNEALDEILRERGDQRER